MSKKQSIGISLQQTRNSIFALLIILLIVLIIALFTNLAYFSSKSDQDKAYVKRLNNLRVYSQTLPVSAAIALSGKQMGFTNLESDYQKFNNNWQVIKQKISTEEAKDVERDWSALSTYISLLISRSLALTTTKNAINKSQNAINQLRKTLNETVDTLERQQSDIRLVDQIRKASIDLETIQHELDNLLSNLAEANTNAISITQRSNKFKNTLIALQQSGILPSNAQRSLSMTIPLLTELNDNVAVIAKVASQLPSLTDIDNNINQAAANLLTSTSNLADRIEASTAKYSLNAILNYLLGALIIMVIIGIALVIERNTRKRLEETADENASNQEAILQLLDEIGDLADGDLTVSATVSEAFTGAIADSINYSIEQLRDLVETINSASDQVSKAAEACQSLAMNLAEAAEHQAGEVAGVSDAISEMARSIDQVSATAQESEGVAQRSVEIASRGSHVVHNTISGMDTIREQIQDTSKRIKRLGESSQEIGNIVGLIDDIAEQTNILALNAAIQASMAGDAGRGFAVVADEVQRLAERSSAATKQIESLVKTIQTDTNEAVISMEQTTSEVVRGAKLAEKAGVALEEIENVSQALAKLIQTISHAASQQASTAIHISKTMAVVQQITLQTSTGSTETALTIGRLANMSKDMQKSVSGFKLPNK